ncbi:MAG: DUF4041 domain-containing protein [Gammaproteobacteria bacterium]|nr:DUF4041 domain-containing protein [Gammaproteobacteria bacterium]
MTRLGAPKTVESKYWSIIRQRLNSAYRATAPLTATVRCSITSKYLLFQFLSPR